MRRAVWMALWMTAGCGERVDLIAPTDAATADGTASDTAAIGAGCVQSATPSLYGGALIPLFGARCLTVPFSSRMSLGNERVECVVREVPPTGATLTCDPSRGRSAVEDGACVVAQLPATVEGSAAPTGHGFFLRRGGADCPARVDFTAGDEPSTGVNVVAECILRLEGSAPPRVVPVCRRPVGARCTPTPPGGRPCSESPDGCLRGTEVLLETGGQECESGLCLSYRYDERSDSTGAQRDRVTCTCRCAVPESLRASIDPRTLCTCGTGFSCVPLSGSNWGPGLAGSYCVRNTFAP